MLRRAPSTTGRSRQRECQLLDRFGRRNRESHFWVKAKGEANNVSPLFRKFLRCFIHNPKFSKIWKAVRGSSWFLASPSQRPNQSLPCVKGVPLGWKWTSQRISFVLLHAFLSQISVLCWQLGVFVLALHGWVKIDINVGLILQGRSTIECYLRWRLRWICWMTLAGCRPGISTAPFPRASAIKQRTMCCLHTYRQYVYISISMYTHALCILVYLYIKPLDAIGVHNTQHSTDG